MLQYLQLVTVVRSLNKVCNVLQPISENCHTLEKKNVHSPIYKIVLFKLDYFLVHAWQGIVIGADMYW